MEKIEPSVGLWGACGLSAKVGDLLNPRCLFFALGGDICLGGWHLWLLLGPRDDGYSSSSLGPRPFLVDLCPINGAFPKYI